MPPTPRRRSIRLKEFDYSQPGGYFTTLCTHQRKCLFGEIVNREMRLNEVGRAAHEEWERTAVIRAEVELGEFVVMPNHIHGIITIHEMPEEKGARANDLSSPRERGVGAYGHTPLHINTPQQINPPRQFQSTSKNIGALIRGYKGAVTARINKARGTPDAPVWQRNYYEHVIRNERDYQAISDYILANPLNWEKDTEYFER